MQQRFLCRIPALTQEVADRIWWQSAASFNVTKDNIRTATVEKRRAIDRLFCFMVFDSPHFATRKEAAYYCSAKYENVCVFFQEFLQEKREGRNDNTVSKSKEERSLQSTRDIPIFRHKSITRNRDS